MWDYLLLLYPLAIFALAFWKCKNAGKGNFHDDAWSLEQGKRIQAIACLCIILHHLTQIISNYGWKYRGPITFFNETGFMFTSVFFFFSGYGLLTSVEKKEGYMDHFLRNRLSTVLLPFWLINVIFVLVNIFYNKMRIQSMIIIGQIFGYPVVNDNGWFMVEITILYLAFFVFFRFIKWKDISILLMTVFVVGMIAFSIPRGHDESPLGNHWFMGEWWYNSTILFVVGMLIARFKTPIVEFMKKYYRLLMTATIILWTALFCLAEYLVWNVSYYNPVPVIKGIRNEILVSVSQMLVCVVFIWFVLLLNLKISLQSKAIGWIGSISLELYLIHGIFVKHLFNFSNWNVMLMYGVVFVCAISSAVILKGMDCILIKPFQKR